MQQKSRFAAYLFSAALTSVVAAVGCGGRPAPSGSAPSHQGLTVRVACPKGVASAVIDRHARGWASRHKAAFELVPYGDADGPGSVSGADVWVIPPWEMPRHAAAGELLPVPDALRERGHAYGWDELLPVYREKLLVWDRKAYALPLLGHAPLAFYRSDLFGDPTRQDAFLKKHGRNLAPPSTWQEVAEVAEFFHGPDRPGLPPLPEDDDALDREFHAVAVPFARRAEREGGGTAPRDAAVFSFHFDLETGAPRVQAPGFVESLRLLQQLRAYRPTAARREPAEAFLEGKAAYCLADTTWVERFRKSAAVGGKFGVCRAPGSGRVFGYDNGVAEAADGGNFVPYLGAGGWIAVVPRGAPHPEAAFALLEELSGPETSRLIVLEPEWGGGATRTGHFENAAAAWAGFGLSERELQRMNQALRQTLAPPGLKNPVVRLRTPSQRAYHRALTAEVRSALAKGADPAAALEAVARRWRELDKDNPSRQEEYRLSLSLTAR